VTIDWAALRTAHGNAAHVPDALVQLHSDREDVRRAAYWQLDNYVVLQGTLFEAAPFVADELIRMLTVDMTRTTRILVYELLYEIHNGYAPDTDSVIRDGRGVPLRKACQQAVSAALPLYRVDLTTADAAVRKEAVDLLASMEERREEAAALFAEAREEVDDPAIMADLERGLRELCEES
jgi:hypothetical protein